MAVTPHYSGSCSPTGANNIQIWSFQTILQLNQNSREIDLSNYRGDCQPFSFGNDAPPSPYCYKTAVLLVPQPLEDLHHGVSDGVDDLVVVVVEGHFDIQAHELSQVAVGVGILGPENWRHANSIQMRQTPQFLPLPLPACLLLQRRERPLLFTRTCVMMN